MMNRLTLDCAGEVTKAKGTPFMSQFNAVASVYSNTISASWVRFLSFTGLLFRWFILYLFWTLFFFKKGNNIWF